jgi:hypothetical protein
MSQQEVSGVRPCDYSVWHRSLGDRYYAIDVDLVEYRIGRGIVALFGITGNLNDEEHLKNSLPMIFSRSDMEFKVLKELALGVGVPAYFVVHTIDMNLFYVYTLNSQQFQKFNGEQYANFIKEL